MKQEEIKITVFTPAFNRAHTLGRCYESMRKQKCKAFKWLIIDDGSTDDTKKLVESWKNRENGFEIIYYYKENGGMHTAHNMAYELIDTELNVCIDSDDCLSENAIEIMLNFWNEYGSSKYAGFVGLDADLEGYIIGKKFPENLKETTLSEYYRKGGQGDKKLVYRTEVMRQYPEYPVFEGEKYVSLGYKYLLCDQDYKLLVLNQVLCNVEYQLDGSSHNMLRQYYNNPRGFAFIRKVDMKYNKTWKENFKTCIHYVSSSLISKNRNFIKESPKKGMTILAIPAGILLTIYIKKNVR
ncbi:glycosyltransferase family 2 protein [Anaerostipes faecalis]|uniref:glycosyltransferase family 2 protein n=1 Tax=Anaerostipes faecalis TaxID=2738446 RepID=UPI003F069499